MARYLIDSHIFLWASETPARLLDPERAILSDPRHDVAVSVASIWELSIKATSGRLAPPLKSQRIPDDHFRKSVEELGFALLPIQAAEAEYIRRLPPIHGDPFDRMLIAQALAEGRIVITRDAVFARYPGVRVFAAEA